MLHVLTLLFNDWTNLSQPITSDHLLRETHLIVGERLVQLEAEQIIVEPRFPSLSMLGQFKTTGS